MNQLILPRSGGWEEEKKEEGRNVGMGWDCVLDVCVCIIHLLDKTRGAVEAFFSRASCSADAQEEHWNDLKHLCSLTPCERAFWTLSHVTVRRCIASTVSSFTHVVPLSQSNWQGFFVLSCWLALSQAVAWVPVVPVPYWVGMSWPLLDLFSPSCKTSHVDNLPLLFFHGYVCPGSHYASL